MDMHVTPVTLEGSIVRLEPLRLEHTEQLYVIAQDAMIWAYMPFKGDSSEGMKQWVARALQAQERGTELPFVTIERATGRLMGSTRYLNIMPHDRGLEIGSTWLTQTARRTGINTECKYLLLRHAFETLEAIRVQLKTDSRNEVSQHAIERIGGIKEGILRNHMIMSDGYYRHSVYYSIIDSEWPTVKKRLETMMERT